MSITFKIDPKLARKIEEVQKEVGSIRKTRQVLRKASKPLLNDAKQGARAVDPSKSVAKALALVNVRGQAAIRMGVRLDKKYGKHRPFYYHYLENGVAPHTIAASKKERLSFTVRGRRVMPKVVEHTGFRPKPYLRPAWERQQSTVLANVTELLKQGIFKK